MAARPCRRASIASFGVLLAFPAVRYLLPTVVAVGLFATPYVPLMPSIVAHFFDGQSSTVGLLMSAAGVGALASAAYLSLQPGYGRQLRLLAVAPLAVGAGAALFAWSRSCRCRCCCWRCSAASALLGSQCHQCMLQQSVPDAWRGRVIGVYSMSFAGTAPIGGLLAGWLADSIGLTATLTLNGAPDHRGRAARPLAPAQPPGGPARADAQLEPLSWRAILLEASSAPGQGIGQHLVGERRGRVVAGVQARRSARTRRGRRRPRCRAAQARRRIASACR